MLNNNSRKITYNQFVTMRDKDIAETCVGCPRVFEEMKKYYSVASKQRFIKSLVENNESCDYIEMMAKYLGVIS